MKRTIQIDVGLIRRSMANERMTHEDVAQAAGIPEDKLRRVLDNGGCDAVTMGRIARALGFEPWELVAG